MKLLVDSDFLISFSDPDDSNHKKASIIFKNLETDRELMALNLVFQESATVVSKKFGMEKARLFYNRLNKLIDALIFLDQSLEEESWKVFLKQTRKGTSFVDCANLAALEKYKLDGILSFDEFYSKKIRAG